jgi:hypothetical protein
MPSMGITRGNTTPGDEDGMPLSSATSLKGGRRATSVPTVTPCSPGSTAPDAQGTEVPLPHGADAAAEARAGSLGGDKTRLEAPPPASVEGGTSAGATNLGTDPTSNNRLDSRRTLRPTYRAHCMGGHQHQPHTNSEAASA